MRKRSHSVWASKLDGFLRDQFTNSSLKLSVLCDHFGISSSYATRLFREHIGMSFHKYLSFYRVEEAKRCLAETKDLIYEIADRCGFTNSNHLIRVFFSLQICLQPVSKVLKRDRLVGIQFVWSFDAIEHLSTPDAPKPIAQENFPIRQQLCDRFLQQKDVFKCAK